MGASIRKIHGVAFGGLHGGVPHLDEVIGVMTRFTPKASALAHSNRLRAPDATWLAESAAEHAVSIVRQGPCIPNV